MLSNLKSLCNLPGISGREELVRAEIISIIKDYCEYETDNLGNLICLKKGRAGKREKKLMVSAHMDEVGMITTDITEQGYLRFEPVGGIDPRVLAGCEVSVSGICGVIGAKAVHMLNNSEKDKALETDKLVVDIGAKNKEQAKKYLDIGADITFAPNYKKFGDGFVCSKALDDRFGCALMIDLIMDNLLYDTYFVFTVQEEIGARGAAAAAFSVQPDISLVLEATTACDLAGVESSKQVCCIGGGAVVSFMDNSNIYDYEYYNQIRKIAEENNIKSQTKTMIAGGNDSGTISKTRGGVRTIAMSLPCRYLHTPSCVASIDDMNSIKALARLYLEL